MMQQGERYQCTNDECGCEISVTKSSQAEEETEAENPTCCCGEEMELMESASRGASSGGSASEKGRGTSRS
jgi:hypothetical protein